MAYPGMPTDPNWLAGLLQPPTGFGTPAPEGFAGTSLYTGMPSGSSGMAADMPARLGAAKPRAMDLGTALRGLAQAPAPQPRMLSEWYGPQRVRG